jgi:hypothetical protein
MFWDAGNLEIGLSNQSEASALVSTLATLLSADNEYQRVAMLRVNGLRNS